MQLPTLACTLSGLVAVARICFHLRLVQAAKPASEVVVPKVDSLVGAGLCLDRLDPLLHQHCYQRFFCCIVVARLVLFSALSAVMFLLLLALFWRRNQFTYKRRYYQWERSFLCQRCGTLI